MQCPNCGKQDQVTIGNFSYCTNCGSPMPTGAPKMSDIRPLAKAAPAPSPSPTDGPAKKSFLSGLVGSKSKTSPTPTSPNPAQQFHARPQPTSPPALDLRKINVAEPAKSPGGGGVAQVKPAIITGHQTADSGDTSQQPVTPPTPLNVSVQTPVSTPASVKTLGTGKTDRQATAAAVSKSSMIQKFATPPPPPAQVSVTTAGNDQPSPTSPSQDPTDDVGVKINPIAPEIMTEPVLTAPQGLEKPVTNPVPAMPNSVATQIDSMKAKLAPTVALEPIHPGDINVTMPEHNEASATVSTGTRLPKPSSLAAAALAVIVMAGYIWVQNYPKMAVRVASGKAGFEASMPSYVPSSFSLADPISYAPGQVTLRFNAGGGGGPLTIEQRKSEWDSSSLLENYVSRKSDKYLAVQNQGLTIYIYNGNQATWVNRGIWYSIEGETKLNRDQILKIASSL